MNNKLKVGAAASLCAAAVLCGCASPGPPGTGPAQGTLVPKKVAYVRSDGDRGGLKYMGQLSESAYRQLDQSLGDALRSVYSDVVVVNSARDTGAIQAAGISYVFTPDVKADFSAPSPYRSPQVVFNTQVDCTVTDSAGTAITHLKANGAGKAEFDEFRYDSSLPARRAQADLTAKLSDQIRVNDRLR